MSYGAGHTNIKKISLIQFRNYSSSVFDFTKSVTCITGANGSGKTNLLDAIYYLCYTKSYFSANQQNSAQMGTDGFRVTGIFNNGNDDDVISCKWKASKKEVFRNSVLYDKIADHIGRYSAVMIAPDDTELINGGSELRRKWVDSILGQVDRAYLEQQMHYQRILLQRNAWLKLQAVRPTNDFTELEYYNAQLAGDAAYIHAERIAFIENFLPKLNEYYHRISGGAEVIELAYTSDVTGKNMLQLLQHGLEQDLRLQRTLRGVHRDDLEFSINTMLLKQFGSQGQKKSFLFALKLAQFAYLTERSGRQPVLLLDDVFEKLDQARMEALLLIIRQKDFGQVILTDTHPDRIDIAFGGSADVGYIYL
ncbi:MAG: DNA replication and repair protein RecF [Taibaiella sp.]|nr:DNA replication and repair protein RecF [Taibaiella sp.]